MGLGNTVGHMRSLLACGLIFISTSALAQTLDKPSLFEEAMVFSQPEISGNALRARSVVITDTSFTGIGGRKSRSGTASNVSKTAIAPVGSLKLNLFDDLIVNVELTNAYQNRSGSQTWIGKIQTNTADGTAAFVIRDGQVYGTISIPGQGNFTVRPGEFNSHIIEETDGSKILVGETDAVIAKTNTINGNAQSSGSSGPIALGATVGASNDDGSIIDVYVGYDQDAAGGSVDAATVQSLVELYIAYTNQAYANSGIDQRVWLVGDVDGYDFTSTTQAADLNAIKDGDVAGLHAKRDEHHADIVMFLRPHTTGSQTCEGLGFLQTENNDVTWGVNAFSIMQACSFGGEIFAHELGHNMGSRHDWYLQEGTTPQTYAHGYIDLTNNFKTIMAYNNRCILDGSGNNCTALTQFSNPLLSYNGNATGVAAGTASDCTLETNPTTECDADNARNFNEKAPTTSKFKDSGVIWTGASNTDWSNAGNWSTNVIPRSYDNVLIPAGLATYPAITAGTAEARELTIANGATLDMSGGTLTVGWAWEDAGGFTATGGTVKLVGPIGVTLTSSGDFNNLEIGSGADTTKVTLESALDVNGLFSVKSGASFLAGANQINIAGNFTDNIGGFKAQTSTVVFDGAATQTVNKTTTENLLNEPFDKAKIGSCGCALALLPTGWAREQDAGNGFLGGDITGSNGEVYSWSNSSNSWLITTAFTLSSDASYTLNFDYRESSGIGSIQSVTAYYGTSQASTSMTAIGGVNANFTTSLQTKQASFTVPTDGVYYIGFNVKSTGARAALDNIKLDAVSFLKFNNVKVETGETDLLTLSEMDGSLEVSADAALDLGVNSTTIDGTVTNNGAIKQEFVAPASVVTTFVSIQSKDGSADTYSGVEITPVTSLGNVTVSVKGNQACTTPDDGLIKLVKRCYTIDSGVAGTAAIKFYYRNAELNGSVLPVVKILDGTDWVDASTTANTATGGVGDSSFVSASLLLPAGPIVIGLGDALDQEPEQFVFTDASALGDKLLTSDSITVTGINMATPISIVGGEYSIGSGAFTDLPGEVNNAETVRVRSTTANVNDATVDTVLSIGVVTDTYTITTEGIDILPDAFTLNDPIDVIRGSTQTSTSITVTGINSPSPISVTGGLYRVGNVGAYIPTTATSTVNDGDIVTVQHTADSAFSTAVNTTLTIGGISDVFTSTTEAPDTTPDSFGFTDSNGAAINSTIISDTITVAGIDSPAAISITGGEYSLNGGAYTSAAGIINNGNTVTVRHTSSPTLGVAVNTVLTIDTVNDTFTSTTAPPDTTPDAFTFTDKTGAVLGSVQTSVNISVSGINTAASISVTGGTYSIDGGAYINTAGTISNGQAVTVQHTASNTLETPTNTVLTIGGSVNDTFTSTTVLPDAVPDTFTFADETVAVALNSTQTSGGITVAGINTTSPISVTGGTYSINGAVYTSAVGTVSDGDIVTVRHTAPSAPGAATNTVLTIGGVADTYSSTTVGPDTTPTAFNFTDVTGVALSSNQTSNIITVSGINTVAPISVTGGSYKIGSAAYTTVAGTVNSGDMVTVQHTASGILGAPVNTGLTIGGVNDTFTSTTVLPDTTPDAFTFTDVNGVALSSIQTSSVITVAGVNTAAAISVSGGTYKVNSGAYTSAAGTVNSGDIITVQHTTSAATSAVVGTVLTIGGVSDTYTSTTEAADTTPVAFTFTDVNGVALSSIQTSNVITVAGINTAASISVTGGSYKVNSSAYTSAAGTVNSGDTVSVQQIASAATSTAVDAVLTIGGISDVFTSTTEAPDTTPDSFGFADISGVAVNSTVISDMIAVAGINSPAAISITGGEYSVNGDAYTNVAGTLNIGDTVSVRHTSSMTVGAPPVETTLTIGGVSDTFTSATAAADTTPDAFTFVDVAGVALDSVQTSTSVFVSGINTAAPISVTGGSYSIDNGAYTISPGTINNGQAVTVRHGASNVLGTTIDTVLTVGNVSGKFSSTTVLPDTVPDAFTFTDETAAVVLSSVQTSGGITVAGINTASAISITGGVYSIDGGAYTSVLGTVTVGTIVTVRHTAPNLPGATTNTELTIGGVSDIYSSTTIGPIINPNPFTFTDVTGVALSSLQTSNTITVIGINTAAPISVTGGSYKIGSGAYTNLAGAVTDGETVTVQHNASSALGATVDTVLTIGGVSDTYTSTTEAADTIPGAFEFTDVTAVALNSTQTSNAITVDGINTGAAISVTGGLYKIGSAAYTNVAGTVSNGDTVTVQHTASAATSTDVDTVLTIGGVSDTYTSTSELPDTAPAAFTFTGTTGVGGSTQVSTSVLVTGINTAAPITVTGGGSYSINGGAYTSSAGTVSSGDTVTLQHVLAEDDAATADTVLDIGGETGTYTSTTVAANTITPTSFDDVGFALPGGAAIVEAVEAGAAVVSAGITVAGLADGATAPISIIGTELAARGLARTVPLGEYSINSIADADFTSEPGNVKNGDIVRLRHSAAAVGGVTETTLKIGTVSTTFVTKTAESTITGTASSGGGSMGVISLMFLSMFTLLCVVRRRRLVTEL